MTATRTVAGRAPWPPLIYLAAIGVAALLGWSYPLPWIGGLLGDLLFAIGWLVLLAVAVLWFTAFRAVTATRTTLCSNGLPEHLVTNGPFAVSRNPIYLANTLLLIGVCFVGALPWFLPLAFVAALA
ncbi:MAG TPA: methyltransferase, partial [Mesorhizobium sp.]